MKCGKLVNKSKQVHTDLLWIFLEYVINLNLGGWTTNDGQVCVDQNLSVVDAFSSFSWGLSYNTGGMELCVDTCPLFWTLWVGGCQAYVHTHTQSHPQTKSNPLVM